MPDEPEAQALLALMLLHDSRRAARLREGELVLLADQDRSLWDAEEIAAGRAALARAIALRGRGPYITQAAIAEDLELDGYLYLHSTRGELLRRLGRDKEAAAARRSRSGRLPLG